MCTSVSVNSIDKPVVGDWITFVVHRYLHHGRVVGVGDWVFHTATFSFSHEREGSSWIRGVHNARSLEGRALLVAFALVYG